MIKFFRRIRQRLLSEKKLSKYFIYALGEIILVVVGILIALQVNNWNIKRQLQVENQLLISSLIADFEASLISIEDNIKFHKKTGTFAIVFVREIIRNEDYKLLDSLKDNFSDTFFQRVSLELTTTSYENAISSGKIALIKNDSLKYLFSDFINYKNEIDNYDNLETRMFYEGAYWELAKELGKLSSISRISSGKHYNRDKFISLLKKPIVSAALEKKRMLIGNKYSSLLWCKKTIEEILVELKCMSNEETCTKQETS